MTISTSVSNTRIYMAPLQGFTDYSYRAAFNSLFEKPDAAFSPFIDTHKPDTRMYRDVLPERNTESNLIPQILGNNATEMLAVIDVLGKMGYDEVNFNLGCPYSMVTKKTMGAGLLPYPEKIDQILKEIFRNTNIRLSVKMRLGLTNNDEWKALVPVLNSYPLTEVTIHARTASQMYKGEVDIDAFAEFSKQLKLPVCYNGNIHSLEQFEKIKNHLPGITRWMLGRRLLSNPLLIQEIRTGIKATNDEILKALSQLHDQLLQQNTQRLSGQSHILNKMKPYWEYFAASLAGREKGLKKIKKTIALDAYKVACNEVFKM